MQEKRRIIVILRLLLSSGICNPRSSNCGYAIRAGHRPAINHPVACKSTGTSAVNYPVGVDLVSARPGRSGLRQAKPLQRMVLHGPRGFAIPEVVIADILSARVADPPLIPPVDYKSTGTRRTTRHGPRQARSLQGMKTSCLRVLGDL